MNPEQTSSWFSFVFFFFPGEIISKASRVPHLPAEEFPPLADYDWASHLVKESFPARPPSHIPISLPNLTYSQHLDPLSGTVKKHTFFGLIKVLRREYIYICFLLVLDVSGLRDVPG